MSHELRTPLNAIIGYSEMLGEDAEDRGDDVAQADIARILSSARHLLSLINDVLDLSKIEAGRMEIAPAPFDPADLAREMLETAAPLAAKNNNKVDSTFNITGIAMNDAQKLRQCLLNLLSNACKFTKNGRIGLSLAEETRKGASCLVFTVSDSGIGITAEQMKRLFQPFQQADKTISNDYGGTGLGLVITQRMAQLMGGDIAVQSTPGAGSTFTLWVRKSLGNEVSDDVFARVGRDGARLVLAIDDQEAVRDLVTRTLAPLDFAVQSARTGEAGAALARQTSPDLILLDINLPDGSGWRVLEGLKADPETSDIPVIVVSIIDDRARSISLGAAEHLVKPVSRDVLCAAAMRLAKAPRERPAPRALAAPKHAAG
jgi:CheY-like chemotaxis protein